MATPEITFAAAGVAGIISFLSSSVPPLLPTGLCFVAGTSLDPRSSRCRYRQKPDLEVSSWSTPHSGGKKMVKSKGNR